jgi:poly(A) polymerase
MSSFPTSEVVYKRLKSDPHFLPHLAIISYEDSIKKKMIDMQLTKFTPVDKGGDVPYHRIYYFKYNGQIIWDRKEKICRLDQLASEQQESVLIGDQFQILTYNVLNDKYFKGKTLPGANSSSAGKSISNQNRDLYQGTRYEQIGQYLVDSGSDIVCLQEVNAQMMQILKSEMITTAYPYLASTSLADDNIVILSKFTINNSDTIVFNEHKQSLIVTLHDHIYHQPIYIIGIHLTSNVQSHSEQKRMEQIRAVGKYLTSHNIRDFILLGDFNSEINLNYANAFKDPYVSYDPGHNPYAKLMSLSSLTMCLDKILYGGPMVKPTESKVDITCLLSDHYPVQAQFQLGNITVTNVGEIDQSTALVAIVPVRYWAQINEIRKKHDAGYERWMPHVTLAHGFLSPSNLSEFLAKSTNFGLSQFTARMTEPGYFSHEVNKTYYIGPDETTNIHFKDLYGQLSLVLPNIFNEPRGDYNPHVTLGSQATKTKFEFEWPVTKLHVISKPNGLDYYKVIHEIPLGAKSVPKAINLEEIVNVLTCFHPQITWKVGGSGVFSSTDLNDLDVVAFGQLDKNEFFSSLKKFLDTCGEFYLTSVVTTSHLSYIKTNFNQIFPVDIHYVRNEIEDLASLSVYQESTKILQSIPIERRPIFLQGLKQIKKLARDRHLYGIVTGFLPGIAWSLLSAHFCQKYKGSNLTVETFVCEFCNYYTQWDWTIPVTLNGDSYSKNPSSFNDKLIVIVTCTEPKINVLRTMTPSTKEILLKEIASHFSGSTLSCTNQLSLILSVEQCYYDQLHDCLPIVTEGITKLIIKVDRILGQIRPFELTPIHSSTSGYLEASWSIGYQLNSGVIEHYCSRLAQKLRDHYPYLSVTVKNHALSK